jgi:tetratricopeptide (TPR) repeat protein
VGAGGPPPQSAPTPARGAEAEPDDYGPLAEDAIRRASKLHEQAKYWDAIQLLEPVVEKAPGKLRTRGKVLLARCYMKNPNWARRAEEMLLGVTRADPAAADAWAQLAQIYVGKSMNARALSMYRKVLELRPDHEEAARFVAESTPGEGPRPEEGGGLLRRLFRK